MYIGMFLPVAELPWGDQTFQMLSLVHFQISLVNNKNIMDESNCTQLGEITKYPKSPSVFGLNLTPLIYTHSITQNVYFLNIHRHCSSSSQAARETN